MTERVNGEEPAKQSSTQVVIATQDQEMSAEMDIFLRNYGFQTETVSGLNEVGNVQRRRVLILDEDLLNRNLTLLKDLSDSVNIPVVVLGKHAENSSRHSAILLAGADYYFDKTRSPELIAACIKAIERRLLTEVPQLPYYKVGDVEINVAKDKFLKKGEPVRLTLTEKSVITYLLNDSPRYHPATEILSAVWGPDFCEETDYVRVYARRVRTKLGHDFLESKWRAGYRVKQGGITTDPNLPQS